MTPPDPTRRIRIEPEPKTVRVVFAGEVLAESNRALVLCEAGLPPVHYLPRDDVRLERLERTDHVTFCPYKGDAAYWSVSAGGRRAENAVWSYETPIESVAPIREHMAFYVDRMDAVDIG